MNMCLRKAWNCMVRGFTVLKHIIIVKIKPTTSRIFTYCGLFLEDNSCDKRGTAVYLFRLVNQEGKCSMLQLQLLN